MPVIASVKTRALRLELARPWGPDRPYQHLIVVEVSTEDGQTGTGFTWTPQIGVGALQAILDQDIAPVALGADPHPGPLWDRMATRLADAGRSGLTLAALAGLDIALWDLRARAAGRALADEIGRRRATVRVYGSGVNRHYSLDELLEQVDRWLAAGHTAVKIKVGRPDLETDLARVAAVRQKLGPNRHLMLDANQLWDLPTARRAIRALERFDPFWIEEPLRSDDLPALADLRARVGTPIAFGESLSSITSFRDALTLHAADYLQPNVVRVGGITPFLRIAELAHAFGVPIAPHLLPDLSGQLALTLPLEPLVEDIEDASLSALGALAPAGTTHGHGLVFTTS